MTRFIPLTPFLFTFASRLLARTALSIARPLARSIARPLALLALLARPLALLALLARPLALLALPLALHGCAPSTCASDSDCAIDSVCLIDADGPRCTTIELAARVVPEGAPAEPGLDGDDVDHEPNESDIVLREATMSFAPEARTATIVMRPISVVVTRSPSTSTSTSTGSDPDPDPDP